MPCPVIKPIYSTDTGTNITTITTTSITTSNFHQAECTASIVYTLLINALSEKLVSSLAGIKIDVVRNFITCDKDLFLCSLNIQVYNITQNVLCRIHVLKLRMPWSIFSAHNELCIKWIS